MREDLEIKLLERRTMAALGDAGLVALCCTGLALSFNPLTEGPHPWIWKGAAGVLAALALLEMLTGITPAKWLLGLDIRRPDGSRPALGRLVLRGLVKFLPVGLFLVSLVPLAPLTYLLILSGAGTLALCFIPICYISMMHHGTTLFDNVADTVVGPVESPVGKRIQNQPPSPVF